MTDNIENSDLTQHVFDSPVGTIIFYSYYNDDTPIYYEIRPFIVALKFPIEDAALKLLPQTWIKLSDEFNDPKFKLLKIRPNTEFVQPQAIQFLINNSQNAKRKIFVEKLYDLCFNELKTARRTKTNKKIQAMAQRISELENKHTHHATILDIIHDALQAITCKHSELHSVLSTLMKK